MFVSKFTNSAYQYLYNNHLDDFVELYFFLSEFKTENTYFLYYLEIHHILDFISNLSCSSNISDNYYSHLNFICKKKLDNYNYFLSVNDSRLQSSYSIILKFLKYFKINIELQQELWYYFCYNYSML